MQEFERKQTFFHVSFIEMCCYSFFCVYRVQTPRKKKMREKRIWDICANFLFFHSKSYAYKVLRCFAIEINFGCFHLHCSSFFPSHRTHFFGCFFFFLSVFFCCLRGNMAIVVRSVFGVSVYGKHYCLLIGVSAHRASNVCKG